MAELLSRAAILGAADIPEELVPVPEWGGSVRVIGMSAKTRSKYEASFRKEVRGRNGEMEIKQNTAALLTVRERLVAYSVVDKDGNRLFADEDIAELGKKSAAALERIIKVAQRLSGMTDADIEELEKNSDETEEGSSSSVSQDT